MTAPTLKEIVQIDPAGSVSGYLIVVLTVFDHQVFHRCRSCSCKVLKGYCECVQKLWNMLTGDIRTHMLYCPCPTREGVVNIMLLRGSTISIATCCCIHSWILTRPHTCGSACGDKTREFHACGPQRILLPMKTILACDTCALSTRTLMRMRTHYPPISQFT